MSKQNNNLRIFTSDQIDLSFNLNIYNSIDGIVLPEVKLVENSKAKALKECDVVGKIYGTKSMYICCTNPDDVIASAYVHTHYAFSKLKKTGEVLRQKKIAKIPLVNDINIKRFSQETESLYIVHQNGQYMITGLEQTVATFSKMWHARGKFEEIGLSMRQIGIFLKMNRDIEEYAIRMVSSEFIENQNQYEYA